MSVPPVDEPRENMKASPKPEKIPEKILDIMRSPVYCGIYTLTTASKRTLLMISERSVLKTKFLLIFLKEIIKSGMFARMQKIPTGKPNMCFAIIAMPESPPGAMFAPSAKQYIPMAYKKDPKMSNTISVKIDFDFLIEHRHPFFYVR